MKLKLRRLALLSLCCAVAALIARALLGSSDAPLPADLRAAERGDSVADALTGVMVALPDRVPERFRRLEVYTYLTIPEWYLVWSSDEYADFIAKRPPSKFPYLAHLDQFWSGYRTIYDSTNGRYPFNSDYHLMIMVIGVSTSAEYGIKAGYEKIVGRLTEAAAFGGQTAEDSLAAAAARRYVEFIRVEPWYRFDFMTPLRELWTETGFWGAGFLRKWERKYFLTSEYAAKAAYGWLLEQGAGAVYGEEKPVTAVVLDRAPGERIDSVPELHHITTYSDGSSLSTVPRYQAFTNYASSLAMAGLNFVDIAGNNGVILMSVIVPSRFSLNGLRVLVQQPITTRPGTQRLVLAVPVRELAETIRRLAPRSVFLEHVYDY